ncbi:MAG TPA: pyridine nucleotide-disulfide oxidoreductase [Clostridiales bacterium]|nr:MAG: pyridine nucleotide-disulfide oxidoreductase [Clostridiales bacterium GWD2_32_59]HAN09743.1 pyridine nucleotide-disulfide oxidoreductase [Clostridiales bacterium]
MGKRILIVGGVAGGATTAARLRRLDESLDIVMFERSPYISFANCGLPYYIGGTIKDRNSLFVQTPKAMHARFNIDIRVENEVISINKENREITVRDIKTSTKYTEKYDCLVLSPGSTPIKPQIPGIDSPNIFSLWNVADTDRIKEFINSRKVKTATVVGGGFIGIEMVENLSDLGIAVTLVEMADQVMSPLDFEMAQLVHNHLSNKGVTLHLKNGVKRFDYQNGVTTVKLNDDTQLASDMVIISIGISPNSELAKACGLAINERGGIIVDERLLTSDENIYAIGDVIEVTDYIEKDKTMIPLAGPANKQGRIVANNICGRKSIYEGSQGTSVAKVFDLTVATTGLNEKQLNRLGKSYEKDYLVTVITPQSHAGYYPGAFPMTLKVIFDAKGKILGAQNVGVEGIDKRIDVIATAIRFGGTIYDLQRLELAYAPPYSSAKDPVNIAGFAAENILCGDQNPILWREIDNLNLDENILVDIRETIEWELGTIENTIHIPVNNLRNSKDILSLNKTIVVFCATGLRGHIASRILSQMGYKVRNLIGGYNLYKQYKKISNSTTPTPKDIFNKVGDDGAPLHNNETNVTGKELENVFLLDACGLQCPGPIMKLNEKIKEMSDGDIIKVSATDSGFQSDAEAWCKKTGNSFLKAEHDNKAYAIYVQKGTEKHQVISKQAQSGTTIVIFSGDFDKALAGMIIANGAAAMGNNVTLFFTFWGLNVLRKSENSKISKPFLDRMFSMMLPRGSMKLTLSKLNIIGLGTRMMKYVMKKKNVDSLEELMRTAKASGVHFVACTMSMDIMGITKDELIDGIEFGGVATYLGSTESSNHNLFI